MKILQYKKKKLLQSKDVRAKFKYIINHNSVESCLFSNITLNSGSSYKVMLKKKRTGATWIKYGNDLNELLNDYINRLK